jgi:hypothetical protein
MSYGCGKELRRCRYRCAAVCGKDIFGTEAEPQPLQKASSGSVKALPSTTRARRNRIFKGISN